MKTQPTNKIEARIKDWGFYGTLKMNLKLGDAETAEAFDRAAQFTVKRLEMSADAARRFLDSKLGRHLANACTVVELIEETLRTVYGTWKRDVREYREMAINTTDEEFYR